MARANRTSSAISTNSPSGGTAGGIPGRRSTTCSAWSPACRTPPCETSSTSGSEQRLPSNAATNPSRREHGRPDRPRHRRGRWRRLPGCPCQVSATGIGSAAAAGEPYRGDDRRGTPGGLVRRRLGHQQPQRLQARGEGDARRLGGQKGMIKTGRRSGADDSATISTHCVTGTNGRSLLSAGTHVIEISADNYVATKQTVTIVAGDTLRVPLQLALTPTPPPPSTKGTLVLDGAPPGAVLTLDGKQIGPAKDFRQELSAGTHVIQISA